MHDLKAIVSAARALRAQDEGRPMLLATVLNVAGSSSRRPAARLLIAEDRWVSGSIGGDWPNGDLIRKAWWFTRHGAPALLSYVSTGGEIDWAIGLECDGLVDLLVQPCDVDDPDDPLAFLDSCLVAEQPGAFATVLRPGNRPVPVGAHLRIGPDGGLSSKIDDARLAAGLTDRARAVLQTGRSEVYAEGGIEALVEAVIPPPHLYLFGAGPDAVPLTSLAGALGWIVTVCDPVGHPWTRKWFSGADEIRVESAEELASGIGRDGRRGFAVVMSHDYECDRQLLGALLQSRAYYIGVLGPDRRTERMLKDLNESFIRRIQMLGVSGVPAETPPEIAVAVTTEIQSLISGGVAATSDDRPGLAQERTPARRHRAPPYDEVNGQVPQQPSIPLKQPKELPWQPM